MPEAVARDIKLLLTSPVTRGILSMCLRASQSALSLAGLSPPVALVLDRCAAANNIPFRSITLCCTCSTPDQLVYQLPGLLPNM